MIFQFPVTSYFNFLNVYIIFLQNAIPIDVFSQFNFSVNNNLNVVQDTLITIIADVFSVSCFNIIIMNVSIILPSQGL